MLVCLATLPFLVHGWFEANDETNDAAMYVACARSILAGEGYSYLEAPFTIRPPGTSWLAAAVMLWRGEDWLALNVVTSLFGVLGVALLHLHAVGLGIEAVFGHQIRITRSSCSRSSFCRLRAANGSRRRGETLQAFYFASCCCVFARSFAGYAAGSFDTADQLSVGQL